MQRFEWCLNLGDSRLQGIKKHPAGTFALFQSALIIKLFHNVGRRRVFLDKFLYALTSIIG